jgi:hypothetical protein
MTGRMAPQGGARAGNHVGHCRRGRNGINQAREDQKFQLKILFWNGKRYAAEMTEKSSIALSN